jgi:hypothetical protein
MIECRKPPASGENRERFLLASGLHRQIIQEAVVVNALRKSLNAIFSASLAHVRRGWIQLVEGIICRRLNLSPLAGALLLADSLAFYILAVSCCDTITRRIWVTLLLFVRGPMAHAVIG